jgi:RNA-directed DNA polymerase
MNSKERREKRYTRRKAKRDAKRREFNNPYDNFDECFKFEQIYDAFNKCRKGVNWKRSTKAYSINHMKYAWETYEAIHNGKYKFKGYTEFEIMERGKKREIKAVHISDRVVQRCLCNSLIPVLSHNLIYDNGASLKGKGITFSLNRFRCMLDRHYRRYGNEGYALIIDASNYFANLQHSTILDILNQSFTDKRIIDQAMIYLDAENKVKGRQEGIGLSLGSQTNQIYAIAYQNKIDHFAEQSPLVESYIRYMDDAILISDSKDKLVEWLRQAEPIYKELGIGLSSKKTQIVKLSKGVKFLKTMHYLKPNGEIVRIPWKKSVSVMRRKLKTFRQMMNDNILDYKAIETSYNSWFGHIKKFDAYRTSQNMNKLFNQLFKEVGECTEC